MFFSFSLIRPLITCQMKWWLYGSNNNWKGNLFHYRISLFMSWPTASVQCDLNRQMYSTLLLNDVHVAGWIMKRFAKYLHYLAKVLFDELLQLKHFIHSSTIWIITAHIGLVRRGELVNITLAFIPRATLYNLIEFAGKWSYLSLKVIERKQSIIQGKSCSTKHFSWKWH